MGSNMVDIFSMFHLTPPNANKGRETAATKNKTVDLEATCDQLVLLTRAMWELLSAKAGVTEQDLLNKVTEIDLRDGTLDGKIQSKPVACSGCGRSLSPTHTVCIYCGAELTERSAFDGLSR